MIIGKEYIAICGDAGDGAELFDVAELVRCQDCKWYKDFDGCFFSTAECEPEHFCSWGERQSADETLREICRDFIGIVEETRKDDE